MSYRAQAMVPRGGRERRPLGKGDYFLNAMLRPIARMAIFRSEFSLSGPSAMSLRALLYRRPSEPAAIEVIFDRAIYLVRIRRHRQARRYTLRIGSVSRGGGGADPPP